MPTDTSRSPAIVWFNLDLRLHDNPALARASAAGGPVIPVFVWGPQEEAPWQPGAASRWWLHHSLTGLAAALEKLGLRLVIRSGNAAVVLSELGAECGAGAVYWNRRYEPAAVAREMAVERALRERGVTAGACPGNLLFEPGSLLTSSGNPFQVFTAFWRACLERPPAREAEQPRPAMAGPAAWPDTLKIGELDLLPRVDWAAGLRESWRPGEAGAAARLDAFVRSAMTGYADGRDLPARSGVSRLSPHLHFGEISSAQVWRAAREAGQGSARSGADAFLRQIAWREFSHHLLHHFPTTPSEALQKRFRGFPWRSDPAAFRAWRKGLTGYPLVDAGMRELWRTGWMHNRVRMCAASFLTKHLLIPWQDGAAWFWDTLVDAGLANNTMGWQWTAGCGADAAPFFRIFNPALQGAKFDPSGEYVRRWVPELAGLPDRWIHRPWEAPPADLAAAGIRLGDTYPRPIVEHAFARRRALDALAGMKRSA